MKAIVASLMRLYKAGRITQEVLWKRVEKGTITEEEYRMIIESADGTSENKNE